MFARDKSIKDDKTVDKGPAKKSQYPLGANNTLAVKQEKIRTVPIRAEIMMLGLISMAKLIRGPMLIPKI